MIEMNRYKGQQRNISHMKMYYEANGNSEFIGEFESQQAALKQITQFWQSHGYKIPYFRTAEYEDHIWIDFGSHTQFYKLYKENGGKNNEN